jgi:DNA-directed RNA polymerase subunit RPC12/RpoP
MPQLVICHKCGTTLFESKDELKPLEDIIQMHDGRCPACKKRLSYVPKKIEVKRVGVPNRINPFEAEKKSARKEGLSRTRKSARKRNFYVSSRPRSGGIWGTE